MLFDAGPRARDSPAAQGEPHYRFLNQSSWPEVGAIRDTLDCWFLLVPSELAADLRARFRSDDSSQHYAAFFELYCIALVTGLGFVPRVHMPADAESSRTPDLALARPDGDLLCSLEVTTCFDRREVRSASTVKAQIVDYINQNVNVPDGYLEIEFIAEGRGTPPLAGLARALDVQLADRTAGGTEETHFHVQSHGWTVRFGLLSVPRKSDPIDGPAIGIQWHGPEIVDLRTSMYNSLKAKTTRYGRPALPYVIALDSLQEFPAGATDIDIMAALFGTEVLSVNVLTKKETYGRKPDGLWRGPKGPRNSRVSAVLFVDSLIPWTVGRQEPVLYVNPWAAKPLPLSTFRTSRVEIDLNHGAIRTPASEPAWRTLGLPEGWPFVQGRKQGDA